MRWRVSRLARLPNLSLPCSTRGQSAGRTTLFANSPAVWIGYAEVILLGMDIRWNTFGWPYFDLTHHGRSE